MRRSRISVPKNRSSLAPRVEKPHRSVPEDEALTQLRELKQSFAAYIGRAFGQRAADCSACPTPCCADAQFVNVNITRLEAVAMLKTLEASSKHGPEKVREILDRARRSVALYGLSEQGDTFEKTYACPLFEPGTGCLVHWKAKPAPCIQHGCYEDWRDLPETGTLRRVEHRVEKLNEQVYGEPSEMMTIPVWLLRAALESEIFTAEDTEDAEEEAPTSASFSSSAVR